MLIANASSDFAHVLAVLVVAGAALWAPAYMEKTQAISRGDPWYTEDGNTTADAAVYEKRIQLGLALGWGSVGAGAITVGASRAGGCGAQ